MSRYHMNRREFLKFAGAATVGIGADISLPVIFQPGQNARARHGDSPQVLTCYVDETGKESHGQFFIVSVVVITEKLDDMAKRLDAIEKDSRKFNRTWRKTAHGRRMDYITAILQEPDLSKALYYSVSRDGFDLIALTAITTAQAISRRGTPSTLATIVADGLSKAQRADLTKDVTKRQITVDKMLGAKKNPDSLSRLADAISGFVREAVITESQQFADLLNKAQQQGVVVELKTK
jgi:hypothetical protein